MEMVFGVEGYNEIYYNILFNKEKKKEHRSIYELNIFYYITILEVSIDILKIFS